MIFSRLHVADYLSCVSLCVSVRMSRWGGAEDEEALSPGTILHRGVCVCVYIHVSVYICVCVFVCQAEEDEEALSPGTILRRARRTSSVCKVCETVCVSRARAVTLFFFLSLCMQCVFKADCWSLLPLVGIFKTSIVGLFYLLFGLTLNKNRRPWTKLTKCWPHLPNSSLLRYPRICT
jgi:hypothetical protein